MSLQREIEHLKDFKKMMENIFEYIETVNFVYPQDAIFSTIFFKFSIKYEDGDLIVNIKDESNYKDINFFIEKKKDKIKIASYIDYPEVTGRQLYQYMITFEKEALSFYSFDSLISVYDFCIHEEALKIRMYLSVKDDFVLDDIVKISENMLMSDEYRKYNIMLINAIDTNFHMVIRSIINYDVFQEVMSEFGYGFDILRPSLFAKLTSDQKYLLEFNGVVKNK